MCSSRHTRLKARGPATRPGLRAFALRFCLCAALLLAAACARGGAAPPDTGGSGVSLPPGMLGGPQPPVGSLGLGLTLLEAGMEGGGKRVTATIQVSDAALLYQFSCRLAYDPLAVKPVSAARAELVDSRAVFFAPLDAAPDYLPLAFTYHPGEAIPAAEGSLARLEFEVLDAARPSGISLLADPQYLVARTALNQPLTVELGGAR